MNYEWSRKCLNIQLHLILCHFEEDYTVDYLPLWEIYLRFTVSLFKKQFKGSLGINLYGNEGSVIDVKSFVAYAFLYNEVK